MQMTAYGAPHLLLIQSEKRFYKQLIKKADERFNDHLARLKEKKS